VTRSLRSSEPLPGFSVGAWQERVRCACF
jgi:hypothetical protein